LGKRKVVEVINGGDNSIDSKNTNPEKKGHPHPWRDGI
jgi:hypothetical protein